MTQDHLIRSKVHEDVASRNLQEADEHSNRKKY